MSGIDFGDDYWTIRGLTPPRRDVTIPDEGDLISDEITIPVEALRAYSMGRLPLADSFRGIVATAQATEPEDDGRRVRVAEVLIDGVWHPL